MSGRRLVAYLGLLLAGAAGTLPRSAAAGHGGALRLSGIPVGPYAVSAWTQPTPLGLGPCWVTVAVMQPDTRVPIPNAVVRLTAEPPDGAGAPVTADATRELDPLRIRYRAELALVRPGAWRVTVAISGPDGAGTTSFPLEIEHASTAWWLALGLGGGAAGLAVAWLACGDRRRALRRRRRSACAAIVTSLLLSPLLGWAHASLVKSSPARRATLVSAPERVQLWFNERIEPAFSRVSVWDAASARADLEDVQVGPDDPNKLSVGLRALRPGTYTVKFRVLSVDGHVVESQFSFTLRGP